MGLDDLSDDFLTRETALVAAAAAVLLAPPVRAVLRRAAVSGVAAFLAGSDGIAGLLPGRRARHVASRAGAPAFVYSLAEEAREERARRAVGDGAAAETTGEDAGAAHAQQ